MTVFMNGLINQWFTQTNADSDSNTETKQKQYSCSCHIAELSGAFLPAYLEISKLAACILCKYLFIMLYIYMIDKNQVQSRYVDEWNWIRDRKDAFRNKQLYKF